MRVLVTGDKGFIGKNLMVRLREIEGYETLDFNRNHSNADLNEKVKAADAVIHLAGVNRPKSVNEFKEDNTELTMRLVKCITANRRKIPLILASSTQAQSVSAYGESKLAAEECVADLAASMGNAVAIYRLPNVFGKWCKPNYNSVIATFCHNIANDLPIQVSDPATQLSLVYIDDVVAEFINAITSMSPGLMRGQVAPIYSISLGELATQLVAFHKSRFSQISERVGKGLVRALYATYVSYLPPAKFTYELPRNEDARGVFVEMLKTKDSGQFSFFTAYPGVTRGGHYHHTKTEKFLVIKGAARFGFRNIITNEVHEVHTSGEMPQVVETVPGWTHDITNVGDSELIVMLWANEIFDRQRPDTIAMNVKP